jgi:hypothetical protein
VKLALEQTVPEIELAKEQEAEARDKIWRKNFCPRAIILTPSGTYQPRSWPRSLAAGEGRQRDRARARVSGLMGFTVRTIGLARARVKIGLVYLAYNNMPLSFGRRRDVLAHKG